MKIVKNGPIVTERLVLKPYSEQDEDTLVRLLTDGEVTKTFMVPEYPDPEQYHELARKLIRFSRPEDDTHLEYGVYLDGTMIGFVNDCGYDDEEIEIGYVIDPAYKNRGYASEAVKGMMGELWKMGFQKISAGFFEENPASRRVMEKCGMTLNGEEDCEEYRGARHRCLYCEIRREEALSGEPG